MAYLVFDIGSSTVKAAIIMEDGTAQSIARVHSSAHFSEDLEHETDSNAWISCAFAAAAQALSQAPGADIRAISVSGHGPTIIPVDFSGKPLGPALLWMDRRAEKEAAEISMHTGSHLDAGFFLPKALHLWRKNFQTDSTLWKFFSCPEYLLFAFCNEAITYLPSEGYLPYFWTYELLAQLKLPLELFPPFVPSATIVGTLVTDAAQRLGLQSGIPVVSGFPDFLAAIVGANVFAESECCDRYGTSEAMNICSSQPFPDSRLLSLPHPRAGMWNVSGGVSSSGSALRWASHVLYGSSDVPRLLHDASNSVPGARGVTFLPYLAGERAPLWNPKLRASFTGISFAHTTADLARAVCEGIAYGLKLGIELARREGIACSLVRLSSSETAPSFFSAIKRDIIGVDFEFPLISECELLGDACACACALGDAPSVHAASSALFKATIRESPQYFEEYEKGFARFTAILEQQCTFDSRGAF